MSGHGGKRPGAGRPRGSKNKSTIALEAVAEILDISESATLETEIHKRGHTLLAEMERIAIDPSQPAAARIMAARVALPFLVPKRLAPKQIASKSLNLIELIQSRRNFLALK